MKVVTMATIEDFERRVDPGEDGRYSKFQEGMLNALNHLHLRNVELLDLPEHIAAVGRAWNDGDKVGYDAGMAYGLSQVVGPTRRQVWVWAAAGTIIGISIPIPIIAGVLWVMTR
jgi:hypothetical protein